MNSKEYPIISTRYVQSSLAGNIPSLLTSILSTMALTSSSNSVSFPATSMSPLVSVVVLSAEILSFLYLSISLVNRDIGRCDNSVLMCDSKGWIFSTEDYDKYLCMNAVWREVSGMNADTGYTTINYAILKMLYNFIFKLLNCGYQLYQLLVLDCMFSFNC